MYRIKRIIFRIVIFIFVAVNFKSFIMSLIGSSIIIIKSCKFINFKFIVKFFFFIVLKYILNGCLIIFLLCVSLIMVFVKGY